jgi:hypothetical protein
VQIVCPNRDTCSVYGFPQDLEVDKNAAGGQGGDCEGSGGEGRGDDTNFDAPVGSEERGGGMGMPDSNLMCGPQPKVDASHESDAECVDITGADDELHPLVPRAVSPSRRLMGGSEIFKTRSGQWRVEDGPAARTLAGGSSTLTANRAPSSQSVDEDRRSLELDRMDATLNTLRGNPTNYEVMVSS